jgi:hypothetical protein
MIPSCGKIGKIAVSGLCPTGRERNTRGTNRTQKAQKVGSWIDFCAFCVLLCAFCDPSLFITPLCANSAADTSKLMKAGTVDDSFKSRDGEGMNP